VSLDALAPDQRAVVQLVLQQDRSYEELAGLLGISAGAVRDRAHKGLSRLAPSGELGSAELGAVADYLLGQQSASERESTRSLLSSSPAARTWARSVSDELADVARSPLPGVPGDEAADLEPEPEPAAVAAEAPVRARPRPRPSRDRPAAAAAPAAPDDDFEAAARPRPRDRGSNGLRSNRLGGALLIGGIAVLLVVGVILLVTGGGKDTASPTKTSASAAATPTATGTPQFQPLGQLALKSTTGGKAKGQMVIFANSNGGIAFTIQGTGVPATGTGEAYAVWLIGGNQPHRLGFAPQVKADGKFGTSGPRDQDATNFAKWFSQAKNVVVSKETNENATAPGPTVLEGKIPTGSASATPTATP
jgi:hypothetical protein